MIVVIYGNIGCGKSTLLNELSKYFGKSFSILNEPIDEWTSPCINDQSILQHFYSQPDRNATAMQFYVLLTRLKQMLNTSNNNIIIERGIWYDLDIMGQIAVDYGWINPCEWFVLKECYKQFITTKPDLIIYLKTEPKICLDRIKTRSRLSESNITLDYLEKIHDRHEDCLKDISWVIDGGSSMQSITNEVVKKIQIMLDDKGP